MKFEKLGLAGAVIIQLSFLPQIFKIVMTHDVSGISAGYYLTLGFGCFLLLAYAQVNSDKVMKVCHTWALINIFIVLGLIWKYHK